MATAAMVVGGGDREGVLSYSWLVFLSFSLGRVVVSSSLARRAASEESVRRQEKIQWRRGDLFCDLHAAVVVAFMGPPPRRSLCSLGLYGRKCW